MAVPTSFIQLLPSEEVVADLRGRSPLTGLGSSLGESAATLEDIGTARQLKWDKRFLELAKHVAQWSKDPSTKVGAVLVNEQNHVIATGYNGFPEGCNDDPLIYADRPAKYKRVVHAEVNAILIAGHKARGCKLYVWPSFANPNICCECCKVAIQSGIRAVVGYEVAKEIRPDWEESLRAAREMMCEAGMDTVIVKP